MPANANNIRGRIDQLKLSHTGYSRQLGTLEMSAERRARLENDTRLLDEEIATLERLANLMRAEPDAERLEAFMRERLHSLREELAADPALARFTEEERDQASGEVRALLWTLGEDALALKMQQVFGVRDPQDAGRTQRNLFGMLMQALQGGATVDARASAAYELGKLKDPQAIPGLVEALEDEPFVAELALQALAAFGDEELSRAGVPGELIEKIAAARRSREA